MYTISCTIYYRSVSERLTRLRNVEKLFHDFYVADELKVHLMKPHLTEQDLNLIARMDSDRASVYDDVKRVLLHEFKLSSATFLDRFNKLKRQSDETYTLYGNRLKSVLSYYVESRQASRFNSMFELLVCDRIKSQSNEGALCHLLSLENQVDDGWLHLDKLLESFDVFYSTHSLYDKANW